MSYPLLTEINCVSGTEALAATFRNEADVVLLQSAFAESLLPDSAQELRASPNLAFMESLLFFLKRIGTMNQFVVGTRSTASDFFASRLTDAVERVPTEFMESTRARYSFVAARPFLRFRSFGSRCELRAGNKHWVQFGNHYLDGVPGGRFARRVGWLRPASPHIILDPRRAFLLRIIAFVGVRRGCDSFDSLDYIRVLAGDILRFLWVGFQIVKLERVNGPRLHGLPIAHADCLGDSSRDRHFPIKEFMFLLLPFSQQRRHEGNPINVLRWFRAGQLCERWH